MPSKITAIFALTTLADQPADSRPHSGGWTESFWINTTAPINNFPSYASARAALLPAQASIIGYRQQLYTIVGNRLIPGGSAAFKQIYPGNFQFACDVPQMALQISGRAALSANTAKFTIRGIPDSQVTHGEFAPSSNFKPLLLYFLNLFAQAPPYYFVGRDLTQIPQRIAQIAGNVLTTQTVIPGVVNNQSFVRILKCRSDAGPAVKGSFLVTAGAGTTALTLSQALPSVTKPNGTARLDALVVVPYANLGYGRISVKKIGRPLESYRGRASKRR
jgi:hypothetical protein